MSRFEPGNVYAFNDLWRRESQSGEETGRKARPTCLMFRSLRRSPGEMYLFPITTQRPPVGRLAIEIPLSERRRCGLDQPCWLVFDELNVTLETRTYDFVSTEPLGRFSPSFVQMTAERISAAIREGLVAPVRRS